MALELERQVRAGDPRIREVVSADYGDDQSEAAIASSTGISAAYRSTTCYLVVYAVAGEGDDTQTGGGYSVCRAPGELEIEKASHDAIERATRMLGATKPPSGQRDGGFRPGGHGNAAFGARGDALGRGGRQGPVAVRWTPR